MEKTESNKSDKGHQTSGLVDEAWNSFTNSMASQGNGLVQLANKAGADIKELPLVPMESASMGSAKWVAQMTGQVAAVAATFGVMRFGLGRVSGMLSGVPGELAQQSLLRQATVSGLTGASMSGLLTPSSSQDRFWTDRLEHSVSGFSSMFVLGAVSGLSVRQAANIGNPIAASVMRNGLTRNAAGGYLGGITGELTDSAMTAHASDWSQFHRRGVETALIGVGAHGIDRSLNVASAKVAAARRTVTFEPVTQANVEEAVRAANQSFSYAENLNPERDLRASLDRKLADSTYGADPNRPQDMSYYVARNRHGEVVGTTGLYKHSGEPNAAWLGWMSVVPEARGQGIGSKLLNFSVEQARAQGNSTLRLYTSDHPAERVAQQLYDTRGFRVVGQEQPNEHGTTILYRERPLQAPWRTGLSAAYDRLSALADPNRWTGRDGARYQFGTIDLKNNQSWQRLYRQNFPEGERQPEEFLTNLTSPGSTPQVRAQMTTRNGRPEAWSIMSNYGKGPQGPILLMPYVAADVKGTGIGSRHVQRTIAELKNAHPDAKGMLIEMEPVDPKGPDYATRLARQNFWVNRQGAEMLPYDYRIPSSVPGEAPIPLNLLWVGFGRGPLSNAHLRQSIDAIYKHGYQLPADDPLVTNMMKQLK